MNGRKGRTVAQKIRVYLIDDIDGTDASETITFAVDGVSYEIDLNEANAAELREAFQPWITHGRRVAGRRATGRRATGAASGNAAAIRAWARENGYEVSDRGRVSTEIREAYEQRNK